MTRHRATRTLHHALFSTLVALLFTVSGGCAAEFGEPEDPELEAEETSGWGYHCDDDDPCPVIFVHGCPRPPNTHQAAAGLFGSMRQYFLDRGYPADYVVQYVYPGPVCDSAEAQADYLSDLIYQTRSETGQEKVSIVAHSFGALPARLYAAGWGNYKLNALVTIGGPNHGTTEAVQGLGWQDMFGGYPVYEGVQEMYPPYACWGQTYQGSEDIQARINGCLTPYGRSKWQDETPGWVDYLSIRNALGAEVRPKESACLNQRFQNDCSSSVNREVAVGGLPGPCGPPGTICPPDLSVLWDPTVMQTVYDFVNR